MAPDLSVDLGAVFQTWLVALRATLTDPRALFWWPTLLTALAGVGLAVWAGWRVGGGRVPHAPGAPDAAEVAPANAPANGATLADRDTKTLGMAWNWRAFLRELPMDLTCYLGHTFTQALVGKFLFWATTGGVMAVFLVGGVPGRLAVNPVWGERLAVAFLVFVFSDFALYWSHRLFHGPRALWWFHRLHHNPPVLTPITAFRFWPPEIVVHFVAFNLGEGVALGLASYAFGMQISPFTWLGINVFLIAWYLSFSHLRHSHVALAYPRWLSHILVSPHMHQAHHSVDPQHHNRNYGTALSLWDWLFRTLYIPSRGERFQFGV